jgi:hypothetical protein
MTETVVKEFVGGNETVEIAGMSVVLAPFCTYKFSEACRLVAQIVEKFGIGELLESIGGLGEDVSATQAGLTIAPLLPKVLRELPDAVREFVAVCCISDAELEELYDEPNAISMKVISVSKDLLFKSRPSELTHAFAKFLGCLEIEDLKNEIGQVVETFQGLMGQPQVQPKRRTRRRG